MKNLLLPAADEAESIWTKKFGFKKINEDEVGMLECSLFISSCEVSEITSYLPAAC